MNRVEASKAKLLICLQQLNDASINEILKKYYGQSTYYIYIIHELQVCLLKCTQASTPERA